MRLYTVYYISVSCSLYIISGGNSTHHQEHI